MRGPCDHGTLEAHLWPLAGWDGESPGEGSSRTSGIDPLRSFATAQPSCYCASCARGRMSETRKITAILAADVVGFSRMTSADEDRTLARLRTLRSELI